MIAGRLRGLYFVADTGLLERGNIATVTREALLGGVSLVQLRAKNMVQAEVVELARLLVGVCAELEAPLVVNDLPAVAAESGAAGVHLGQDDVAVADARRLLGEDAIIGATTPTRDAVLRAEAEGADYVSAGPIFRSPTKPEKPVAGPQLARTLRAITALPLCAIGGIDEHNVGELAGCGVDLVCVISAISAAPDPRAAAERLLAAMRRAGVAAGQDGDQ